MEAAVDAAAAAAASMDAAAVRAPWTRAAAPMDDSVTDAMEDAPPGAASPMDDAIVAPPRMDDTKEAAPPAPGAAPPPEQQQDDDEQVSLGGLDAHVLAHILAALDASALVAASGVSVAFKAQAEGVAEAACAAAATRSPRAALLRRRFGESWAQLLWLLERDAQRGDACRLGAGTGHTVSLSRGGRLFVCGRNGSGQLGTGQTHDNGFEEYEEMLIALPALPIAQIMLSSSEAGATGGDTGGAAGEGTGGVVCVGCGDESTVAVDDLQRLWCWGHGHGSGELTESLPKMVPSIGLAVRSVSAGGQHCAAIDEDGRLYTWGQGMHGQLGHADTTNTPQPKKVTVWGVAAGRTTFGRQTPGPRIASVGCAAEHTAIVDVEGGVWTCGRGWLGHGYPQLAQVTPLNVDFEEGQGGSSVICMQVACGAGHTAVVAEDGNVWTFGVGTVGQLGHPTLYGRNEPGGEAEPRPRMVWSMALRGSGPVVEVACGRQHTMMLTGKGEVWTFGEGISGQLGRDEHGENVMMREISGGTTWSAEPQPVVLPGLQVVCGPLCIPGRCNGKCGRGCMPAVGAGAYGPRAVEIAAGASHSVCLLASKDEICSWGAGSWGRLGQGDETDRRTPTALRIKPRGW